MCRDPHLKLIELWKDYVAASVHSFYCRDKNSNSLSDRLGGSSVKTAKAIDMNQN